MYVETLTVRNFRNYDSYTLNLNRGLTVLVGANAVGKTNLIEALQLLTTGESFRRPIWKEVIREGAESCKLELTASGENRELKVALAISGASGRTYIVNGSRKRSVSAATGSVPCVLFTPADLSLVQGPSAQRRISLDVLGSQLSASYAVLTKEYSKILRQRNALLKDAVPEEQLEPWTNVLAETGSRLMFHRQRLLERVAGHAIEAYAQRTEGEAISLRYVPSWERAAHQVMRPAIQGGSENGLKDMLALTDHSEQARGTTLIGPHRDDVEILLSGRSARSLASQGQQRTIALSWKMAEAAVMKEVLGEEPLLLLDDVMSELDEDRRAALARWVRGSLQTVMTTTTLQYFDPSLLEEGAVVTLRVG